MKKANHLLVLPKLGSIDPSSGASPAETLPCQESSFALGFTQPEMKLTLRSVQHKLYLMAKELRRGHLSSQINFHPPGKRDLMLKNKDNTERSEADGREAFALFFWGKGWGFPQIGCHVFLPFLVCNFQSWLLSLSS